MGVFTYKYIYIVIKYVCVVVFSSRYARDMCGSLSGQIARTAAHAIVEVGDRQNARDSSRGH